MIGCCVKNKHFSEKIIYKKNLKPVNETKRF